MCCSIGNAEFLRFISEIALAVTLTLAEKCDRNASSVVDVLELGTVSRRSRMYCGLESVSRDAEAVIGSKRANVLGDRTRACSLSLVGSAKRFCRYCD